MDWTRGHVIGQGSSATVYLAVDSPAGDLFAVKSTELSQSQSLQREQQFLSTLASPYVVSYRGCEVRREPSGALMFNLFLEYLPNGSLADAIRRHGGRLHETAIGIYTRDLLQGLQYIHSKGLVHCDIKARNVLIGGDGGAKLADFGCAKWATQTDPIGGTPLFMAPEVARGEQQGPASDIWSIGCTVIEMATGGGSPWYKKTDGDPISALYRIAYSGESPETPSFLSEQAKDFLEKCLRRNPEERWTADQLVNHPFLGELNSMSTRKQIQIVQSDSPTSILEQGIWRSIEERSNCWAAEQIRRLSMVSGEPRWTEDENWMTIRTEEIEKGSEVGDEGEMIGGSESDSDSEVKVKVCSNNGSGGKDIDKKKNVSCKISRNDLADHRCRKISLVHNYINHLSFHTNFLPLIPSIL